MALVDTISIQRARKLALNGIIVTSFWSVLSLINMSIFGKNVSLMILPLMSIFLWPRLANPLWSIMGIFLIGIMLDLMTGSILGVRSFLFLSFFAMFRPDQRDTTYGFSSLWLNFSLAIAVLAFILVLIGFFLLDRKVSLEVLLSLCFTAVLFFPVVYVVVLQLSKLSSDSAGIGYAL